jgi:hypothetical protein
MHAKRTLFNYGKIFVITRPLPSTIPIPALFSHPPCLTLQMTPTTNCLTSSRRVPNSRGTQTLVSPPPLFLFPPFRLCSTTMIDKTRQCTHNRLVLLLGAASAPAKRGRGRPKGSKNKKSAAGTAASASEVAPAAGEKRKRGRPPKVRSAELFPKCTSDLRDCGSPRMSRRRVRRVNPPRSAREEGHQKIPSLALLMTRSERVARLTLQPSESGAGPRRTPPE